MLACVGNVLVCACSGKLYRVWSMKKYILVLSGVIFLLISGVSCRQHDFRTIVVDVPEMKNQACVNVIVKTLGTSPGLSPKSVNFNTAKRQITVKYDSLLTADKNIEFLIAKAGFAVNAIPADKKAAVALPVECRR